MGIVEGLEGTALTKFISSLIQDLLGLDEKPPLDRAHHTLQPKPNQPRRPVVVRVHFFHILKLIRRQVLQAGQLTYNGYKLFLFLVLTASEAKNRAALCNIRRLHREIKGARCELRYLA